MQLSSISPLESSKAVREFTDRDEPRKFFREAVDAVAAAPNLLRVLTYYGMGGIGKTLLLRELEKEFAGSKPAGDWRVVFLDLESPRFIDPADYLHYIARELQISYLPFEFALARYWEELGLSKHVMIEKSAGHGDLLKEIIEAAAEAFGFFAPVKLVTRLAKDGHAAAKKLLGTHRELFEKIRQLESGELQLALPHLLAEGVVERFRKRNTSLLFIADGHSSMMHRMRQHQPKTGPDAWLRDFIGEFGRGVFIIASREKLRWAAENPAWIPYLEQHFLGRLDDADAERFLASIPIIEPAIRSAICASAQGVPLYLDLSATTYLAAKRRGALLNAEDFHTTEECVIRRFLDHLDSAVADALRICSACDWFDRELFQRYTREFHIPLADSAFEEFCHLASALVIDQTIGQHAIHSTLRHFLVHRISDSEFGCVLRCVLQEANRSLDTRTFWRAVALFTAACAIPAGVWNAVNAETRSLLARVGRRLIETGFWKHVEAQITSLAVSVTSATGCLDFLRGLCARRGGRLEEARSLFESALSSQIELGNELVFTRFHQAHVIHLLGHYDEAVHIYEQIEHVLVSTVPQEECSALAVRQHADVLMLKGRFVEAEQKFALATGMRTGDLIWNAEIARFRGHIRRFNFLLEDALSFYRNAEELAKRCGSADLSAKILTSKAETLAWYKPRDGLRFALAAIRENESTGNMIEVGKALAAAAIASDDNVKALDYARSAHELQTRTGYRSGVAFALQAQAFALLRRDDFTTAGPVLAELKSLINDLKVYEFLLMPLEFVCKKQTFHLEQFSTQWLDASATALSLTKILSNRRE